MKKSVAWSLVFATAVVLLGGCAGFGRGPSDQELVADVVAKWKAGMTEPDIDKMMSTFSENFMGYEGADKEAVREFMQGAMDMGYLDDAEVSLDEAETKIEGDTATVYPIDLDTAAGSVTIRLTLTKEAGGWLITGQDIEGL